MTLLVNPLPEVTIVTTADTLCESGVIWVSNVNPSYDYQWSNGSTNTWTNVNTSDKYYVTATDVNHCSKSDSVTIVVDQTYIVSIDTAICQGQSFDFDGELRTATGVYMDTIPALSGCDTIVILTLTVKPLPNLTISGDSSFCQGSDVALTAYGADTYEWSDGNHNPSITVNSAGTYTVMGSTNGCSTTASKKITVNSIDTTELSFVMCSGESYYFFGDTLKEQDDYTHTLFSSKGCDSVVVLHLTVNPTVIKRETDTICQGDVYPFHGQNLTEQGEYSFTELSVNYHCDSTTILTLHVNPTYNIAISDTICWGESIIFDEDTLTETGVYTQTLHTVNGCDSVITLTLIVNPSPMPVIYGDNEICNGDTTTLTAIGGSDCSYVWSNGGDSYSINVSESGSYTVTVTNEYSCSATADFRIIVDTLPNVSVNAVTPICNGQMATLTATGASNYTWDNGLGVGNDKLVSPTATTNYSVTGTDDNGCSNTSQVTVAVNQLPNVSVNPVTPICCLQNATLTATEATNYIWSTGDSVATISVSPSATTTYSVTGTDDNGCQNTADVTVVVNPLPIVTINVVNPICSGQNATLTAMGGNTYTWDNGLGIGNDKQVSPTATTNYSVTGTDGNGCQNTAEVTVTVNQLPIVTINQVTPICNGQTAMLTATGASTYTWDNGLGTGNNKLVSPTLTTSYAVTGVGVNGCSNTAQVTVTVNPLPLVTINQVNPICSGQSATLTAMGATNYSWDYGLGMGNNKQVSPSETTTYHVTGTDGNGCSNTGQVTVVVNPLPTPVIYGDNEICVGEETATLTAVALGNNNYIWNTGATSNSIIVDIGGQFWVTVTNTYTSCSATASFTVNSAPSIEKKLIVVKKNIDSIPYMLIYPDSGYVYQWYNKDGLISGAIKQYFYPGEYGLGTELKVGDCYKLVVSPISSDSCGVEIDTCITQSSQSEKISILPNPNNGQFRLMLPEGTVNVQILNVNGQVVMARKVDGDELLEMNTGLANGLYFVKSFREDGNFNTEKLIINR
jgi:hypothetical protein